MQRRNLLKAACAAVLAPLYAVVGKANPIDKWTASYAEPLVMYAPTKFRVVWPLPWERYFAKHNIKWSGDVRKYSAIRNDPEWEEVFASVGFTYRDACRSLQNSGIPIFTSYLRHRSTGEMIHERVSFCAGGDGLCMSSYEVNVNLGSTPGYAESWEDMFELWRADPDRPEV